MNINHINPVNITLKTLAGDLLQIAVDPYDTLKTVAQKLVMSEDSPFRCATFVRIVRLNEDEKDGIDSAAPQVATLPSEEKEEKWSEGEMAAVFYDPQPTSYTIHDNGGIPFIVEVKDEMVSVYFAGPREYDEERDQYVEEYMPVKEQLIIETPYKKLWVGDNDLDLDHYEEGDIYAGNSILVQLHDSTYMYIGSEIYKFCTEEGDHINMFFSPIGRNDVPYPYAIGDRMAYFMLDRKAVSVDTIDVNGDAYRQFYEIDESEEHEDIHDFKLVEQVQKRI